MAPRSILPRLSLGTRQFVTRTRQFATTPPRLNTNPPSSPEPKPSSFKEVLSRYKVLGGPFSKVFLGALFTYQVVYWCWLKLEMDEEKVEKNKEVAALEAKTKELTGQK